MLGITILACTAYHSQAGRQSERIHQIIEIAIHFIVNFYADVLILLTGLEQKPWIYEEREKRECVITLIDKSLIDLIETDEDKRRLELFLSWRLWDVEGSYSTRGRGSCPICWSPLGDNKEIPFTKARTAVAKPKRPPQLPSCHSKSVERRKILGRN